MQSALVFAIKAAGANAGKPNRGRRRVAKKWKVQQFGIATALSLFVCRCCLDVDEAKGLKIK